MTPSNGAMWGGAFLLQSKQLLPNDHLLENVSLVGNFNLHAYMALVILSNFEHLFVYCRNVHWKFDLRKFGLFVTFVAKYYMKY